MAKKNKEFDCFGEFSELLPEKWAITRESHVGLEGIIVSCTSVEDNPKDDSIAYIGILREMEEPPMELLEKIDGEATSKKLPVIHELELPYWIAQSVYKQMKNKKVRLNMKLRPILI